MTTSATCPDAEVWSRSRSTQVASNSWQSVTRIVTKYIVRFPDPPYGVGREKEPPRSWEKNFEATKLRSFQWRSLKLGAFWNSAHVKRPLTLVSLTHLHWLPRKNQFYPTARLQLCPPRICKFSVLLASHWFLRISNDICKSAFLSTLLHASIHSEKIRWGCCLLYTSPSPRD